MGAFLEYFGWGMGSPERVELIKKAILTKKKENIFIL